MTWKRPSLEQVRARKLEIKRRYERQSKVSKRSRSMAAIRLSELTRWLQDGPALETRPNAETIVRIFVHHFISLRDGHRRAGDWLQFYCPSMPPRDREYLISEATHCPLKWSADKLGWKLALRDEQRARLKIKTIGAIDVTREQRKERDRLRRAEREKARRAAKRALHIGL